MNFLRLLRLSSRQFVVVAGVMAALQLASAHAQTHGERVILRPDLAYPAEHKVERERRPMEDAPPAQDAAPTSTQPRQHPAPLRAWTEPTPDWSALPGLDGAERFAPMSPSAPQAGIFWVNNTADTDLIDSVLTLREAILVANGATIGPFTSAEQAMLTGCTFNTSGYITGGCGANIQDTIFFSSTLGFRPVITLGSPLPPISDTQPTLLLGAFLNNVQPVINAQNLPSGQPGLVVNSDENQIVAVSVISAPLSGILLNGNQNFVGTWTMVRNNGGHGIYIAGLTNTVSNSYIGVFSNTVTNAFECAGNALEGIYLAPTSRATTIQKNRIGCNSQGGIMVGNSSDNLIGGSSYITHGNLIYANGFEGIYLSGSNARRNLIQANDILDNGTAGVRILASRQNTVTIGASSSDFNRISGNGSDGVRFEADAQNNLLAGARVEVNGSHGVNIISGTLNTISRTLIHDNARDGIRQHPNSGANVWQEMRIYDNGGLGIDTGAANDTSNTPDPPYFFITSFNPSTGLVQGKANGTAFLIITIVDLYRIDLDPTGFGEGYEFVGSDTTDSSGNWSITDPNPSASNGCYTAVVRGLAILVPYATEFTRSNCAAFAPIVRKP